MLIGITTDSGADGAETWQLNAWKPAFDYSKPPRTIDYAPISKAAKPWHICASYPHLKDSYWASVNYGMVEQARAAGVGLTVVEAGGYPNLERQIEQIQCSANADALIVGTVSYDGLTPHLQEIARRIPVIAAVNDIDNSGITAKWCILGRNGSCGGKLFRAPPSVGFEAGKGRMVSGTKRGRWVKFVEAGFLSAMQGSAARIVAVKWGDTGFEIQLLLIEELLEEHPDIDYIVGSASTADAAVSICAPKDERNR